MPALECAKVAGCVRDWRVDDSGVVFWLDGAGPFIGVEVELP